MASESESSSSRPSSSPSPNPELISSSLLPSLAATAVVFCWIPVPEALASVSVLASILMLVLLWLSRTMRPLDVDVLLVPVVLAFALNPGHPGIDVTSQYRSYLRRSQITSRMRSMLAIRNVIRTEKVFFVVGVFVVIRIGTGDLGYRSTCSRSSRRRCGRGTDTIGANVPVRKCRDGKRRCWRPKRNEVPEFVPVGILKVMVLVLIRVIFIVALLRLGGQVDCLLGLGFFPDLCTASTIGIENEAVRQLTSAERVVGRRCSLSIRRYGYFSIGSGTIVSGQQQRAALLRRGIECCSGVSC